MSEYNEQRAAFDKAVKTFDGNNSFAAARALLLSGEKTVSFNRKIFVLAHRDRKSSATS